MKPSLVLVITDQESNAQVKTLGVDFLELRLDLFKKLDIDYARRQFTLRRKLRLPLILTIRNQKKEGAQKEFPDQRKLELLQALVPLADWIDIELSSRLCAKTVVLAREHKKKVLISTHDFHRIPHLEQVFKKALSTRADMVKISAQANSPQDLMRMMEFTDRHKKQPLVTMCVGKWGPLSRLLLPSVGSRWVYTFLSKPTAPGQLDAKTLKNCLRVLTLIFLFGLFVLNSKPASALAQVFCTQEAKICPDGSAVGRQGPNCEFAPCPAPGAVPPSQPEEQEQGIEGTAMLQDEPYQGKLLAQSAGGYTVVDFFPDEQGKFKVSLPPGSYSISSEPFTLPMCKPVTVGVNEGAYTVLTISCDTGIR